MSDRATGYSSTYGATGRGIVSWRVGDHLQAGRHLLRTAAPPQRNPHRDSGVDHRRAGSGAHPHGTLWGGYSAAVVAASLSGVIIIAVWLLILEA